MTAQYAFDTLAFVKRLSAAGMETPHAEALAEALVDSAFNNLATKTDLRELQLATNADLRELEHRLTNKLTVRMGAMTAATIAIIGALKIFS
ncbi:MAG: hypothetical protein QOJ91_1072 [Sphingomonadales bacterium]|jgi:hypothetical protein|nr:hypothetical protein [Sphingomonadales bacterium]